MNVRSVLFILLTLAIDVSAMYFGYITLWVLGIFVTLILILSAVMAVLGIWSLKFRQLLSSALIEKGNEAQLILECRNKGIFLYPKARIFYRSGEKKTVSVYPGTYAVYFGYAFQRKGKYHVGIKKITVYGAFGIFCRRIRFDRPETLYVLPKSNILQKEYQEEVGRSSEEGVKKKNAEDRSTVSYLRGYQYGDTLNTINWKATAKHNEVIVNQRENEFCTRAFIYVDSTDNLDADDHACDLALSHVKNVLDRGGTVTLLYSGKGNTINSNNVKNFEEFGIYLVEIPERSRGAYSSHVARTASAVHSASTAHSANTAHSASTARSANTVHSVWENDLKQIGQAVFQKDIYNQAVFYLHHDITPEIDMLIRELDNMHIKVEVLRIAAPEGGAA